MPSIINTAECGLRAFIMPSMIYTTERGLRAFMIQYHTIINIARCAKLDEAIMSIVILLLYP